MESSLPSPSVTRVSRQLVLRRIDRGEPFDRVAQLDRSRAAEVVLVPVEVVLGRDFDALEVLLHDEVHDAGDGIRAVHRGRATRQDVDALDHLRRNLVEVRRRARRAAVGHAPTVDQHERARVAETAKVERRRAGRAVRHGHVLRSEGLRQLVYEVLDSRDASRHDVLGRDLRHGRRRLEVRGSDARARDDDLTQVFLRERRSHTGGRQCAHDERATYSRCDLVFTFHCLRPPANGQSRSLVVELPCQPKTETPSWRNRYGPPATWMGGS